MEQTPQTPIANVPDPINSPETATSAPVQSAPSSGVTSWPGAFKLYGLSRRTILVSLSTLILLIVAGGVASFILSFLHPTPSPTASFVDALRQSFTGVALIVQIAGLLLSAFVTTARSYTVINSARGQRVGFNTALQKAVPLTLKVFVLSLLVGATYLVSFVLLIIPFFFVYPRLVLAQYFLVDQNLGILEAYRSSWKATKGNVGKVWGILGVGALMVLPVITILGAIVTVYLLFMYSAAYALLYHYVINRAAQSQSAAGPSDVTTSTLDAS